MIVLRTMVSVTVKERGESQVEDGGRSEVDGDRRGEGQESMSDQLLLTECRPMPSDM